MLKTRKSVVKRMKISATGKLIRRGSGLNHFNAKSRRVTQRRRSSPRGLEHVSARKLKRSTPGLN